MPKKNPHDGHRDRMRTRIINEGIFKLQEHEVLEYLLYSFIPRKDTNALAHCLIEEFGSLYNVLNASPETLLFIPGMTKNASLFLSVLADIVREYGLIPPLEGKMLGDKTIVKEYLGKKFVGLNEERVLVVALDVKNRILAEKFWSSGMRANVEFNVSEVVKFAKIAKAVNILIAHNHPGGRAHPSTDDVSLTLSACSSLKDFGFTLQDHIIFDNYGGYYSFKDNNYIQFFNDQIKEFKEGHWSK